ncbi:hypothetical protein [Gelidibacter gilvus]|uniref:Uncharacterized protein n=1 Tax=Gelidibacter gilvus TaxID=59602 RepID=A0A4Q0XGH6_9FLAO|nr:hypothetical protein [Gelidibacter gilvus]RXJ50196.1 hypothetical protein ESZ48_09450 [Gelidibacter gilvus]
MSEQKDNTNMTHDESVSKIQETPIASVNNVDKTESKRVLKAEVVKKKSFSDRMKTHRFFLVRGIYYIFYSVWAIVMGIGMVIAWLIAMLFI